MPEPDGLVPVEVAVIGEVVAVGTPESVAVASMIGTWVLLAAGVWVCAGEQAASTAVKIGMNINQSRIFDANIKYTSLIYRFYLTQVVFTSGAVQALNGLNHGIRPIIDYSKKYRSTKKMICP
jgi:hypothetical protein